MRFLNDKKVKIGSLFLLGALLLAVAVESSGCGGRNVVLTIDTKRKPLPKGSPFFILRDSPPDGSTYLGQVFVRTRYKLADEVLNTLRRKVRLAGGNCVANFTCRNVHSVTVDKKSGSSMDGSLKLSSRVNCEGKFYLVPYD